MNYRMVCRITGQIGLVEAAILIVPFILSACYRDGMTAAFAITILALLVFGLPLTKILKPKTTKIYAREGFVIVALSWIVMSLFGALPGFISGNIPNYADSFFETVSGFTTTGATILGLNEEGVGIAIESLPKSLLFWRAFTHWLGGMGVLVFALAILPQADVHSMHIMRAEVPGPTVGKLVSKTTLTARILYGIYLALTIIEAIFLLCGGVDLFDSVTLAFSTAGTGGFAGTSLSVAYYDSVYVEVVITVFMILFSLNFNLYFLMLTGQFIRAIKSEELLCFAGIVSFSMISIAINIMPLYSGNFSTALRYSSFQVASIISTAGFATTDFNLWPTFSKIMIVLLMFVGACAGSTGGGLKVSRVIILLKTGYRELLRALNPKLVRSVKLEGKPVDKDTVRNASGYFVVYILFLMASVILLSFEGFDLTTTTTAVITCINNVGPGFNVVGPMGGFSGFSNIGKLFLSFVMLVGRLEIYPMLIMFLPGTWRKR